MIDGSDGAAEQISRLAIFRASIAA